MLSSLLLILGGVVLVLACTTPPASGEGVSPGWASPLPTDTAAPSPLLVTPTAHRQQIVADLATPASAAFASLPTGGGIPVLGYRVINSYPHDPNAFTQGLVYQDGFLYEGTGYWAQSSLRKVELETGQVLQQRSLPAPGQFGEGIVIWGETIIQLTWQDRVGFVYDKDSFELLDDFSYHTEGWGITHDGARLIMSDGSATLHFWNPDTFEEIGQVQVHDDRGPVTRLNELEYIDGLVYANVWLTDRIAIIDPDTGQIVAWIDLTGLLDDLSGHPDVLNGIAYDAEGERLFVTGKWWPKLYQIELVSSMFLPLVAK